MRCCHSGFRLNNGFTTREIIIQSIREFFKFHSSFKGRINRRVYISITIKEILLILLYVSVFAVAMIALMDQDISKFITVPILTITVIMLFVIGITGMVSQITCWVKRVHDLNLPGYWVLFIICLDVVLNIIFELIDSSVIQLPLLLEILLILVAFVAFLVSFICLFFLKGTKGDNRYGPDPLQEGSLRIPRLSKSVLTLLIVLPVLFLIALTSVIIFKGGVSGGLEDMQKGLEKMETAIEERQMEKKKQCELLIKKCEGISEEDTGEKQMGERKHCKGWLIKECEKILGENTEKSIEEGF